MRSFPYNLKDDFNFCLLNIDLNGDNFCLLKTVKHLFKRENSFIKKFIQVKYNRGKLIK